jgi:hypothetical protein
MFSKFIISALALAATVTALPGGSPGGGGSGSSGSQQCCQNVQNWSDVDSSTQTLIAGLLGVAVSDLNVPIGTGCTPVAILGGVSW